MQILKAVVIAVVFLISIRAQNLQIFLKQKYVIGADENAPIEYLFHDPRGICVDRKNNVYIADYNVNKVRVFTEEGKFIKYIGKTGQGPGEFQYISSITIDSNDELIVTDPLNMRITRFSNMGEKYKCYRLSGHIGVRKIARLNSDEYILYYFKPRSYHRKRDDNLFHVYSKEFKLMESFAAAGEVYNFKEKLLVQMISLDHFATMVVADSVTVLFVPGFYDGIVYMYKKIRNKWTLKKLYGKKFVKKPYKLLKMSKFNPRHHVPFTNVMSGVVGRFYYKELCRNYGIVFLNDSTFAHFSESVIDANGKNRIIRSIELFNLKKGFIGYASGDNIITIPKDDQWVVDGVFCKDYNDNVYVSEYINGLMAVKKIGVKYNIIKR